MLRFLADENLNAVILKTLEQKYPEIEIVRVQDLGLSGSDDSDLLKYAAREQRVLVSHDKRTMPKHFLDCHDEGVTTVGVVLVPRVFVLNAIVEQLAMIAMCVEPEEMKDQCWRLPL